MSWKNLNLWKLALGISSAFIVAPLMHKAGHLPQTTVDTALFSSTGNLAVASDRAEEFDVWRDVFFFGGVGIGLHSVLGLKKGKAAVAATVQDVSKPPVAPEPKPEPVVVTVQPQPEPEPVSVPSPTPEPEVEQPEIEEEDDFGGIEEPEEEPVQQGETIWVESFDLFEAMWNHHGHFGIAAGTQAGKTSTLLGFIDYTQQKDKRVYHLVSDPKWSRWGGLEKCRLPFGKRFLPCVTRIDPERPNTIEDFYRMLQFVAALRSYRAKQRYEKGSAFNPPKFYVWLDEWPTTRLIGNEWDTLLHEEAKAQKPQQHYTRQMPQAIRDVVKFFNLCAEEKIHIGFVAQSPLCQDTGFNTGNANNFAWIGLGRKDQSALELCLSSKHIVRSPQARKMGLEELPNHVDDPTPTVYTSLGGHKLFAAPDLSHIKSKAIFLPTQEN